MTPKGRPPLPGGKLYSYFLSRLYSSLIFFSIHLLDWAFFVVPLQIRVIGLLHVGKIV